MATKVRIFGQEIPAIISGTFIDNEWDGRASKTIKAELTYDQAAALFVDNVSWELIYDGVDPETNQPVHEEIDNSDYCIAGPITDYRDGTVSVKMGRLTEVEQIIVDLYGGDEE